MLWFCKEFIHEEGDDQVFHKNTTLAIMPILASGALQHENKTIQ